MGVLFDYFAAPDDAAAAGVVDQGPSGVLNTVSTQIDCVVQLAYVEELLGGRSFAEQLDDPRTGGLVEQRADGELVVLTISNAMQRALARAADTSCRHRPRVGAGRGVRRPRRSGRARSDAVRSVRSGAYRNGRRARALLLGVRVAHASGRPVPALSSSTHTRVLWRPHGSAEPGKPHTGCSS